MICERLNNARPEYLSLVRRLPQADALTTGEKLGLERIAEHVTDADAMRALFVARWGSGLTTDFSVQETWRLWKAMNRLPASHVEHGQVARFLETEMGPAGRYSPTDHTVEMDPGLIKNDKGMPLHDRDGEQDKTGVMSRAEFMALFEMSADVLDKQIADQAKAHGISPEQVVRDALLRLALPGWELKVYPTRKGAMAATKVDVLEVDGPPSPHEPATRPAYLHERAEGHPGPGSRPEERQPVGAHLHAAQAGGLGAAGADSQG